MELGFKSNEVKLVCYDARWKNEFRRVKQELVDYAALPEDRIEHIGSTAIPGMPSKPVIDIAVGLESWGDVEENLIKKLAYLGFLRLKVVRPNEIVFAKFTDETFKVKTHFIHLIEFSGELWQDLIFFRNFLRENGRERTAYAEMKTALVNKAQTDINEYTNGKEAFVQSILEEQKNT